MSSFPIVRPRRNRVSHGLRSMTQETILSTDDLVLPVFVTEGENIVTPVGSMPGVNRLSIDQCVQEAKIALELGIRAIAIFPHLVDRLKDSMATESTNPLGLAQRCVRAIKSSFPEMLVITDVAMDPYSSDGHDGIVRHGQILNDETLEVLAAMAVSQAQAGADIVAPSDMMDGRVGYIRGALDRAGFSNVPILAYSVKYASACYGPFRDALDSAPKEGDKKSYQMNPANVREALREVALDVAEGADIVMVKPASFYLDIISQVRQKVDVPVAAYQVSGEYAMIMAASQRGWLDLDTVMMESLMSIKRAGADIILTYFAKQAAGILRR